MPDPVNKPWHLSNADVVRLRNARDIVDSLIPAWQTDGRYSAQLPELEATADALDRLAQTVEDYLAVENT